MDGFKFEIVDGRTTKRGTRTPDRDAVIVGMFTRGMTYQQVGDEFNVTRQRIEQIIRKAGIKSDQGGSALRALTKLQDRIDERKTIAARREEKFQRIFGCSVEEADRINGCRTIILKKGPTPSAKYLSQKENARHHGKGWEMTLPEWWAVWQESGHWDERGRGKGYCMARYGDAGPYKVGNVYICTVGQNFSDSYITIPAVERLKKNKRFLNAKGYTERKGRFHVQLGSRTVGTFGSILAARRAYLKARREIYGI